MTEVFDSILVVICMKCNYQSNFVSFKTSLDFCLNWQIQNFKPKRLNGLSNFI